MSFFLSIDLDFFLGDFNLDLLKLILGIIVLGLLECIPRDLLLLLNTKLGRNPSNAEALVCNPEHLGLDQSTDVITLVNVVLILLVTSCVPERRDILAIGVILLGIGLEEKKLELEGIGVLLLLGKLDVGVVVSSDHLTGKLLAKERLAVLKGVVDGHRIDLLNEIAERLDPLVGFNSLEGKVERLLEGVGLVSRDPKRRPHLRSLDNCLVVGAFADRDFDIVSTVGIRFVLAKSYGVNRELVCGEYGRHFEC